MSDYERIQSFIDGAKTGIDWMYSKGRCASETPSEYAEGFRHALDAISGHFDDIASDRAPKAFGAVVDG